MQNNCSIRYYIISLVELLLRVCYQKIAFHTSTNLLAMVRPILFLVLCILGCVCGRDIDWEAKVKTAIRDGDAYGLGYLLMQVDKLEAPALINSEFCGELTPLQFAAKTNDGTIETLLAAGAIPNLAHKATLTTPLMFAARSGELSTVELLLEVLTTEDVNAVDEHGSTALALCSLSCNERIARKLMYAGASPFVVDKSGNTALHVAAWYCQDKSVSEGFFYASTLLGLSEDEEDAEDRDAIDEEEVLAHVNRLSESGRTALMLAAKRGGGSSGVYATLLSVGADVDVVSPHDQKTALDLKRELEELQKNGEL
jgi:ankyrin repeat protein